MQAWSCTAPDGTGFAFLPKNGSGYFNKHQATVFLYKSQIFHVLSRVALAIKGHQLAWLLLEEFITSHFNSAGGGFNKQFGNILHICQ